MKFIFTLKVLILVTFLSLISEDIEINLGADYAKDVWYDFNGGIIKTEPYDNWDIAFIAKSGPSAGIWTNSQKGILLYAVPNSNEDSWEDPIDTTNMSRTWQRGDNSIETWEIGAFNLGMEGLVTGGDYGWGAYNMTNHAILGNKVFVMKMADKTFKKVMIESLLSGVYTIKWADLDGSNEQSAKIKKSDYGTKIFVYLDLATANIIDREPESTTWALLFGKYTDLISMGAAPVPYTVTGVRTNPDFRVAEVRGFPSAEVYAPALNDDNYSYRITTIGSDWKKFNMSTYAYDIIDSLAYFVTYEANDVPEPVINKIVFKTFEGTTTGKIVFKLNDYVVDVEENNTNSLFNIYPTIAEKNTVISIDAEEINTDFNISIYNITGNLVYTKLANNLNTEIILPDVASGVYYIKVDYNNKSFLEKIIIK